MKCILTTFHQRFNVDVRKITADSMFVLTSHSFTILHGLILSYLSARIFIPEVYGSYQFVLSFLGILGVFRLIGMSNAIARDLNIHDTSPLVFTMKRYALVVCFISVLLLFAIPFLQFWNRSELWSLFIVAAIFTPLDAVFGTFALGIFVGKSLFKTAMYYALVLKVIQILGVITIFIFFPSPTLLLLLTFGSTILLYSYFTLTHYKQYNDESNDPRIFNYGVQLSAATVPTVIAWHIDAMLIAALFGMSQLAMFSVAIMVPEQFKLIFKELLAVTFSHQVSGKDSLLRRRRLLRHCTLATLPFILVIIVYYFSAPYIFEWVFPRYNSIEVIQISRIAFTSLITVPWNLVPQYLEAQGFIQQTRSINLFSSIIFVLFLAVLIPWYGLFGAIISRLIFRFSYLVLSVYYLSATLLNKV